MDLNQCCSESLAVWLTALGTITLAVVAVFQDSIRGWLYRPRFDLSIKTEPPDCVKTQMTNSRDGTFLADAIYLKLWVENVGNSAAKNAEVYAQELRRKRMDGKWERVVAFPPMNLNWADIGGIYFSNIAPKMGKHCDMGHIADPSRRTLVGEDAPKLELTNEQASLAFALAIAPNHRGHIIGPGEYELDVLVAAENAPPIRRTVTINVRGPWYPDEATMLRDGVGVGVKAGKHHLRAARRT